MRSASAQMAAAKTGAFEPDTLAPSGTAIVAIRAIPLKQLSL